MWHNDDLVLFILPVRSVDVCLHYGYYELALCIVSILRFRRVAFELLMLPIGFMNLSIDDYDEFILYYHGGCSMCITVID